MDPEIYRDYCLSKPFVTEGFPFDEDTLVFKVKGKIFALCNLSDFTSVNLKCEPSKAIELREQFDFVNPGYHMNKQHWNTITFDRKLNWNLLKEWIDHSYEMVAKSLPKKEREEISKMKSEK